MSLKYDPEFEAAAAPILAMMSQMPQPPVHDVASRRESVKALRALLVNMPSFPDVERTEYKFKSYDGVELSVYRSVKQGTDTSLPGPAVLHIHGGGMIAGDTDIFHKNVETLVSLSGVQFFDVEYRLAPEVTGTSLVDDCYAALLWLHDHAQEFNIDKSRIGVMGESAGGGIAAGVSLMARDKQLQPPLAKSILVYPMLDYKNNQCDPALAKYLMWTVDSNITGWTALLGEDAIKSGNVSSYASPAHAKDVSGLPSTYIDCGTLDLFRDEDTEFARRLAAANNHVEYHLYPGVPHAFELLGGITSISQQAAANRLKALKSF